MAGSQGPGGAFTAYRPPREGFLKPPVGDYPGYTDRSIDPLRIKRRLRLAA
jgi:hypothetical protein